MTDSTDPHIKDSQRTGLSYRDAGVDIDAGNRLVERIKTTAQHTMRPGVLTGLGGFGALFEVPLQRYKEPVLVSGTDGVGTKLKLAFDLGVHNTIGIDLVAMCANDLIVQGAEPLYFLDYFATGKLDVATAESVIEGIGHGCKLANAALIGGETAEMPGMYGAGEYDLAGFCVGIVEKSRIIDGRKVQVGDQLIGIASSGPHSNGYSLIRKILESSNSSLQQPFLDRSLGEVLLEPTRIYVEALQLLLEKLDIHAVAHITGGGLLENIPRVLPQDTLARIDSHSWSQPAIFGWLQEKGSIAPLEMMRTFNCGVGMVLCVAQQDVEPCLDILSNAGESAWRIGTIETGTGDATVVID